MDRRKPSELRVGQVVRIESAGYVEDATVERVSVVQGYRFITFHMGETDELISVTLDEADEDFDGVIVY